MPDEAGNSGNFTLTCSPGFPALLDKLGGSLAFTTYQAGKLFALGLAPDGRLSVFERTFARAMGLGISPDGRTLVLATQFQIHRFDNLVSEGTVSADGYDAIFAPHAGWVTGDLDAHDVAFGTDGRPVFANTLFSCIATVSDGHSFRPTWKPPFISGLAPEDRCHLNGLAVEQGVVRYATAVARSDAPQGWRDVRVSGGIVMDVSTGEIIATGLSMPHSPRIRGDRLWVLNSGTGQLGFIDRDTGRFEPIAFCPGYARGLAFAQNYAIVGLSLPRESETFSFLPLDDELRARGTGPLCGLAVIDIDTAEMAGWVQIEGIVRELYDVVVVPNVRRPSLVGFKSDQIRYVLSIEE